MSTLKRNSRTVLLSGSISLSSFAIYLFLMVATCMMQSVAATRAYERLVDDSINNINYDDYFNTDSTNQRRAKRADKHTDGASASDSADEKAAAAWLQQKLEDVLALGRKRVPTSPEKICSSIILRIPLVCTLLEKALSLIQPLAMFSNDVLDACNSAEGYMAMSFAAKRRKRSSPFTTNEHQNNDDAFHYRGKRQEWGVTNPFGSSNWTWCTNMITSLSKGCKKLLGPTIANNLRNFAWVCDCKSPFGGTASECGNFVKNMGDICRATLDSDFDNVSIAAVNATPPAPPPLPASPVKSCESYMPSMFGFCWLFRGTVSVLFGSTVGCVVSRVCDGWYDGLLYVFGDIPFAKLYNGTIGGIKRLLQHDKHGNNKTLALEDASHINNKDGSVAPQHARSKRGVWPVFKKAFDAVGGALFKSCYALTLVLAPLCQKVFKSYAKNMWALRWGCMAFGKLAGLCLLFWVAVSNICATDMRPCNPMIPFVPKNCSGHANGLYPDSNQTCANYYFQCKDGSAHVITCKDPQRVYVAGKSECVKRIDVPHCHYADSLPPCVNEAQFHAKVSEKPLACDPTTPLAKYNDKLKQTKHVADQSDSSKKHPEQYRTSEKEHQVHQEHHVPSSGFNAEVHYNFSCAGKSDGVHQNPFANCSRTFFSCKKNVITSVRCNNYHEIFHPKSTKFLVFHNTKTECFKRSEFPECTLPSCPANHKLRWSCDPEVPAPPVGYDTETFKFNCSGKSIGFHPDPYNPCSPYFYACTENNTIAERLDCNFLSRMDTAWMGGELSENVFVYEFFQCIPKSEYAKCRHRLKPCPKDHELRKQMQQLY